MPKFLSFLKKKSASKDDLKLTRLDVVPSAPQNTLEAGTAAEKIAAARGAQSSPKSSPKPAAAPEPASKHHHHHHHHHHRHHSSDEAAEALWPKLERLSVLEQKGERGRLLLMRAPTGEELACREHEGSSLSELKDEVRRAAKLSHAHLLRCRGAVLADGKLCVLLEHVGGGGALADVVADASKRVEPLAAGRVWAWVGQLGSALAYVHEQKLLHRDVTLRNIKLRTSTDDAVLGEFGSAGSGAAAMTRVAGVPYEMRYASPAIAEGAEARTESDEAWALGVCVYELLALR